MAVKVSIKKKLILAYFLLVILPMITMVFVVTVVNSPDLDRLEGGFNQLDKQLERVVYSDVLKDLQEIQTHSPASFKDQAFLESFFKAHDRVMRMTVSDGSHVIYQKDITNTIKQISSHELIVEELEILVGDDIIHMELTVLPLNLMISGSEIKDIINMRFKWGLLSYLTVHLFFIGYVLKYFLIPFRDLKNVANKVSRKEYDFEVDTSRNDEIGETFRAFEGMRQSIQSYETSRKEFVANISHDLKTPITALKGYISAISDGVADTPEKMNRYLEIMDRNVVHLDQLVDDLLLHSKLDVDQVQFDMREIEYNKYLDYLIDDIRLDLEPKGIVVTWNDETNETVICKIDAFKLRRVILNIVDNAVKHFNKEDKRLSLKLFIENKEAVLIIEDNGKGIAKEELDLVFERFYRTDSSRNTSIGGSGLGLAISKQMIHKHGGSIKAHSELGVFTSVEVRLPVVSQ